MMDAKDEQERAENAAENLRALQSHGDGIGCEGAGHHFVFSRSKFFVSFIEVRVKKRRNPMVV